ncbi:MAG: T9SS type A sorting domain-containing protein [Crocinitomicaceae bacterium]|jgi:hypothetical protein|nr:T9SS type A sorting domain-containing protein [Crocinitomicaceae bacterium]
MRISILIVVILFLNYSTVISQSSNSLQFDGLNDHVIVQNDSSLMISDSISINAWVNVQGNHGGGIGNIVFKQNLESCNFNHIDFRLSSTNNLQLVLCEENGCPGDFVLLTGNTALQSDQWYFVSGTYDGAQAKVYVDAVLDGNQTKTIYMSPENTPFSIGSNINDGSSSLGAETRFFNGYLDDIHLWSKALSIQEIEQYMNCPPNGTEQELVAFWNFEEGTGSTLSDLTTNNNDGVLTNSPTWSIETPEYLCNATSNSEIIQSPINVYPNPISNGDYLRVNQTYEQLNIYNIQGEHVSTHKGSEDINISNLTKGFYLLIIDHQKYKLVVE